MAPRRHIAAVTATVFVAALGMLVAYVAPVRWGVIQAVRSVGVARAAGVGATAWLQAHENAIWAAWENNATGNAPRPSTRKPLPIYLLKPDDTRASLDLSRPLVARGMLDANHLESAALSLTALQRPPLSELDIDYFTNATTVNTVPNAHGRIGEIVHNITHGGPEKITSQFIVLGQPSVLESLVPDRVREIWGDRFAPRDLGLLLTVPVFLSRGPTGGRRARRPLASTTRTDLHCEPIGNVMLQLHGSKRWTLVSPEHSHMLRPTVSPDNRAYFNSMLDPLDPQALAHVPRYEVITHAGDALWVPPWTWHRVEYLENITALSASLFHFRPLEYAKNNPLFAATVVPNLIKELVGLKTT